MDTNVGDIVHCEEQLKTTLHFDDKEKLRRKLAQLQREYLKTAQRLQRAERVDAVRKHVRSRISQQNQLDQRDPEVTSDPCVNPSSVSNTSNATVKGIPQLQGHTEDLDTSRRSQVIRFILPSDAAFPQTPDIRSHERLGHRPSPALRLRSRRSRLRWEKRDAKACWGKENSKQSKRLESATTEEEEGTVESKGADVVEESEELFSSAESESSSLLLTHWNTQGHSEAGPIEGRGHQRHQQQREKETEVEGKSCELALTTGEKTQNVTQHGIEMERTEDGASSRGQGETPACKKNGVENTEQKAAETAESNENYNKAVEKKEESNGKIEDGKAVNLLDSCTLVEGLLFPAEYYVRTTRRMTFSHSQPDLQAVILSQLSIGRHRRSRGRGRGPNRETLTSERSDQLTQTDFSSPPTASTSSDSPNPSHVQAPNVSTRLSRSSGEISNPITACQRDLHACSLPMVATARPPRGRRKRRGRGKGRSQTSHCEQTSGDIQTTGTPLSFSQLLHKDGGANPRLSPHETVLEPEETQPASIHLTASQPSPGVNGDPSSSLSECLEKVYPIFLKSSIKANKPIQLNRDSSSWPDLLLPSSSSPAQTSLRPLSMFSGFLGNNLMYLDMQQDFHLPDEQFASLKLHKLRQAIVESGREHFSTPSRNTRSSLLRSNPNYGSSEQLTPRHFPSSYTPTITNSPHPNEEEQQPATQHIDLQNLSAKHVFTDKLISESLTEVPSEKNIPETDEGQQAENLHTETLKSSTESVSVVEAITEDRKHKGHETVTPRSHNQSSTSVCIYKPEPQQNFADRPVRKANDCVIGHSDEHKAERTASTNQTDCGGVVHSLKNQRSGNSHVENRAVAMTLSSDYPQNEKPEEPSDNCTALQACNDTEYPSESPVNDMNAEYSSENSKVTNLSTDGLKENQTMCRPRPSQLLLSSPLAPAPCPFITPHLTSSALTSSPMLPSLGLTPHRVISSLLPHSSPSAPSLTLPPPHSPSTQALSPPALSPCASFTHFPPSLPPLSLSSQVQASCEPPALRDQCQEVEPATCPTPSSLQLQSSAGQVGVSADEAEKQMMRRTHTLKAAAGGALVDVCCLPGSSGGLCVAAAGKWAVCLWTQTSASDWSLRHTWTFSEPVINVFPVPDAAGLMCVTLGQLEIREMRVLSCSSLMQTLVCDGVIQAVVGISESRVVTSSHSASGSTLQVFTLSDSSSSPTARPLVSPGVCVGALAPVEGLSDALIGTDEGGHLFIWNLKTGQLLRRVPLGDGLSHTACLRGYSYCGVLLVLLQHHFLSSLEEEEKVGKMKDVSEEETKTAFFSLVGVNPLSGKSILAARLYPPKAWSGRLCEADVNHSSVLGLSQSGCACVWELGQRGASKLVEAPEGEDWQLARWGGRDRLVIGHHNGDVSLHCYSASRTSLCN